MSDRAYPQNELFPYRELRRGSPTMPQPSGQGTSVPSMLPLPWLTRQLAVHSSMHLQDSSSLDVRRRQQRVSSTASERTHEHHRAATRRDEVAAACVCRLALAPVVEARKSDLPGTGLTRGMSFTCMKFVPPVTDLFLVFLPCLSRCGNPERRKCSRRFPAGVSQDGR